MVRGRPWQPGGMSMRQTPSMADPPKDRQDPEMLPDMGAQDVVFPYRGTEPHGVAPTEHPDMGTPFEDVGVLTEVPHEQEQEPVPVRIVSQGGKEIVTWRVVRTTADANIRNLIGRNERRRAMRIRNMDATHTLYISPDDNATAQVGWPVPPNSEVPFTAAQAEVYGVSDDGTQIQVAILSEQAVEL